MRITCPACNSSYDVPETMLGPRQAVRCVRCAREWVPPPDGAAGPAGSEPAGSGGPVGQEQTLAPVAEPPAPHLVPADAVAIATADPVAPERGNALEDGVAEPDRVARLEAMAREEDPPVQGAGRAWLGWLGSLLLLCALATASLVWRGGVERAWPPSVRLYAALGLAGP